MSGKLKIENYISDNVLDMSLLQLTEIPAKVKTTLSKSVTTLNFSNNLIVSIPPSICSLIQIKELNLSKNKLKELPDQIGDLANLTKLDLYDNQLSFLPLTISNLKKLKWLDISSNPIPQALAGIAGPCQTAKECEDAAQNLVKYFGVLSAEIREDYERAKKLEKEKREAEVKTAPKPKKQKTKKEAVKVPEQTDAVSESRSEIKQSNCNRIHLLYYLLPFVVLGIAYLFARGAHIPVSLFGI